MTGDDTSERRIATLVLQKHCAIRKLRRLKKQCVATKSQLLNVCQSILQARSEESFHDGVASSAVLQDEVLDASMDGLVAYAPRPKGCHYLAQPV